MRLVLRLTRRDFPHVQDVGNASSQGFSPLRTGTFSKKLVRDQSCRGDESNSKSNRALRLLPFQSSQAAGKQNETPATCAVHITLETPPGHPRLLFEAKARL